MSDPLQPVPNAQRPNTGPWRTLFNRFPNKIRFFQVMRAYSAGAEPQGKRLLDIASNRFRMAFLFPGADYVGGDIDMNALRRGMRDWPGAGYQGVCCDLSGLPFADGSFDIVISTHTIVHLRGAQARAGAVAELLRVTAPGGDMVFNVYCDAEKHLPLEDLIDGRFASIERTAYCRWIMDQWVRRLVMPNLRAKRGLVLRLLSGLSPVVHLVDHFGAPTQVIYVCKGRTSAT